jgi:hypothetical protein
VEHVWTWGGKYFGYFDGDDLWTHDGRHVGRRDGDDVFNSDGTYLGEVMNENRLITNKSKKGWRGSSFSPWGSRVGVTPYTAYVGYVMYAGYEDFPAPRDT